MRTYTKEELRYYFQTMKEKYKNSPTVEAFESVELSMFSDVFKADNLDTVLNNRKE